MSSVVKKSSHFTPKLKKKAIRRKGSSISKPTGIITPPTTQVSQIDDIDKANKEHNVNDIGIASSQKIDNKTPNFNFSLQTNKPDISNLEEDDVDPMDTTKKVSPDQEEDSESDNESQEGANEYGDNDIFKKPEELRTYRRQSSIRAQRRLSGITPNIIRNRTGSTSVSITPTSSVQPEGTDGQGQAPMKIGIPISKPSKRRALGAHHRPGIKKALALNASIILTPKESQELATDEEDNKAAINLSQAKFVIGIDPKTNKLRKYRTDTGEEESSDNEGKDSDQEHDSDSSESRSKRLKHKLIPIAPKDLDTRITSIKQLPRKVEDSDLELFSQIGVQVDTITMADLCKPSLPIGEISENFQLVKEAQEKIRKQKLRKRVDRMRARTERKALEEITGVSDKPEEQERKKAQNELLNVDDVPTESTSIKLSMQNGSIVVDEDSTIVNRHRNHDTSGKSREESNPFENPITSSTYSKRKHTDRWTPEELKQFYTALSTWGTDFTFIAQLFPYRTRKQIKLKFNLEEKKYPEIVEIALRRKLPADFDKYCDASKNKFETLEFYNEELKQMRLKHEQHMAEIVEERQKAIKEDAEASRRREIEIRTGSKPMTRAEKVKELRKNEMVLGSIDDVKKQRTETD